MNIIKSYIAFIIILNALFILPACKTKKLAQKPVVAVDTVKHSYVKAALAKPIAPPPVQATNSDQAQVDVTKLKIQFEFDSSVLKTEAYPVLDQVASAMKMEPSEKFALRGYASFEGTPEHNMTLSEDRANAVRIYLINDGVSANNITAKGYGTANPVGDNDTESGRILNRRVEIGYQYGKKYNAQAPVK